MKLPLPPDMLAELIVGAIRTPRAVMVERLQLAALQAGARWAAHVHAEMIATAPDVRAALPARPALRPAPQRVTVEVVTLDPSKLSQKRTRP